ncbi:MAG: hypothetical protein OEY33_00480 [Bdellovibrionales bacterium]|jgi:hypothetical protein|nr:hypothetical protein [Bdellovibrionales bacterium]
MNIKQWYPLEDGKHTIELNINRYEQLYDKKDPNPYRKRDLDEDVVEYITSSYFEVGEGKVGKLRIFHQDDLTVEDINEMKDAIHEYFEYRTHITKVNIKYTLKTGYKSLSIGLIFLVITILSSKYLNLQDKVINSFLKELLLLIGWVSMWKPINIFLYEWWPFSKNKKMHLSFSSIPIEIIKKEVDV